MEWQLAYGFGLASGLAVGGLLAAFVWGKGWADGTEILDALRHGRDVAARDLAESLARERGACDRTGEAVEEVSRLAADVARQRRQHAELLERIAGLEATADGLIDDLGAADVRHAELADDLAAAVAARDRLAADLATLVDLTPDVTRLTAERDDLAVRVDRLAALNDRLAAAHQRAGREASAAYGGLCRLVAEVEGLRAGASS